MNKIKKMLLSISTTLIALSLIFPLPTYANQLDLFQIQNNIENNSEFNIHEQVPLTDIELEILQAYKDGEKMIPEHVQIRKEKAEELQLLDYVDERYFLTNHFYEDYGVSSLYSTGGIILIDTLSDAEFKTLIPISSPPRKGLRSWSAPVVTEMKYVTWVDPNNSKNYIIDGFWILDGTYRAFCANFNNAAPLLDYTLSTPVETHDVNVLKLAYYGAGGPGDILSSIPRLGNEGANIFTSYIASVLVSNIYPHWDSAPGMDAFAKALVDEYKALILAQPNPPSNFHAYLTSNPNWGKNPNGVSSPGQPMLIHWLGPSTGSLQMKKESSNPEMSNDNDYYSLSKAEYGVYKTKNEDTLSNQVGTLTIGDDGWSNTLTLEANTYYIKEIKAPLNYELDPTIYTVNVTAETKTSVTYKDIPLNQPIQILLSKIDQETNTSLPQGNAKLENAQFTVHFYKGDYDDGIDPSTLGKTPNKTWVIKTDAQGNAKLSDEYKVSGDSFYLDQQGQPTLPLGTITFQETKAPIGYHLNPTVFVKRITANNGIIETYNSPSVLEKVIKFRIKKLQENSNITISNVTFNHIKPNGTSENLTTNSVGEIEMVGLETGIHRLKEITSIEGLELNPNEFQFEVLSNGDIKILTTNLIDKGMFYEMLPSNDGQITFYNTIPPFDFKIIKINDKNLPLDGAEFTLYEDALCTKVLQTSTTTNGKLTFSKLNDRTTYYLKETKAPKGYRIPVDRNGKVHVYEVYTESIPSLNIFNFYIDGEKYTIDQTSGAIHLEGTPAHRIVSLTVTNYIGIQLPTTGSYSMIPLLLLGSCMMGIAIYISRKKKGNN